MAENPRSERKTRALASKILYFHFFSKTGTELTHLAVGNLGDSQHHKADHKQSLLLMTSLLRILFFPTIVLPVTIISYPL